MNKRFAQIRESVNLTTRKFAERLNISAGSITNMEKGIRNITDRTIADVCREFNVSEEWFRTGNGEMFNKSTEAEHIAYGLGKLMLESESYDYKSRFIKAMLELEYREDWELVTNMMKRLIELQKK